MQVKRDPSTARAKAPVDLRDALRRSPVLAVLRGKDAEQSVRAAEACWAAGVELVEVSLSHDRKLEAVRAVCDRAAELGRTAGAGTVYTPDDLRAVAAAGATFAVAPGLDGDTVRAARALGLPYLPGVATPSDVQAAVSLGCTTLKLFPAGVLGAAWIRALAGPFPEVDFVAVGGLSAANAEEFVAAGAVAVGIGSGLDENELPGLLERLRSAASARSG